MFLLIRLICFILFLSRRIFFALRAKATRFLLIVYAESRRCYRRPKRERGREKEKEGGIEIPHEPWHSRLATSCYVLYLSDVVGSYSRDPDEIPTKLDGPRRIGTSDKTQQRQKSGWTRHRRFVTEFPIFSTFACAFFPSSCWSSICLKN